jgi:hypothetical protein
MKKLMREYKGIQEPNTEEIHRCCPDDLARTQLNQKSKRKRRKEKEKQSFGNRSGQANSK